MHRFGDILEEAILGIQSETAEFQVIRDAKDCIGPHWYGLRCRVTCRHFRTGFYLHIGLISNDVEAGWAGSLGMEPGIHLVSGTGSIAFGKNKAGKSKRSGGWSAFFGDEGSCCWLGRRTMELFSKQADGRIPVGPLYHMMRERFQLKQDMDFIACMEAEYIPVRSKTASLQKLLLDAAKEGDESAKSLYRESAEELGMMAESIASEIFPEEKVVVSYSGGLFYGKENW